MNNQAAQTMPELPAPKYKPEHGVYDESSLRAAFVYWENLMYLDSCGEDMTREQADDIGYRLKAVERAMEAHDHTINEDGEYVPAAALSQTAGVPDRKTLFEQAEVLAACYRLKDLVEGVGCERWQNANGFRLKDTQQWVEFYNVVNRMQRLEYPPAAAPSASGVHPDALPDGTLSKSTAKRLAAASVSERAREIVPVGPDGGWCTRCGCGNDAANFAHLPSCNAKTPDAAARARSASLKEIVPTEKRDYLDDNGNPRSIEDEAYAHGWNACRSATLKKLELTTPSDAGGEREDEDYHVIMTMGRLLAEIAVILKGTEPAGSAWSYHDLPELVKSSMENAHDIASEMRAWAAVKMRERGSSRRDKMMVEEWSKRLLALHEVTFPVKDFDIPGLSITKEEIRFAIRKVVEDRVFIGQDFGDTPPNPGDARMREDSERLDWIESQVREYGDGYTEPREAGWGIQWQQERPDHYWPGLRAWIDSERERDALSLLDGKGVSGGN